MHAVASALNGGSGADKDDLQTAAFPRGGVRPLAGASNVATDSRQQPAESPNQDETGRDPIARVSAAPQKGKKGFRISNLLGL